MKFSTAAVLSIYADKMLLKEISGVYEILNFLLDDSIFTHQIPKAIKTAQPALLEQLPWLSEVEMPSDRELLPAAVEAVIQEHGEEQELHPIDVQWKKDNALNDLLEMTEGRLDQIVIVHRNHPEKENNE